MNWTLNISFRNTSMFKIDWALSRPWWHVCQKYWDIFWSMANEYYKYHVSYCIILSQFRSWVLTTNKQSYFNQIHLYLRPWCHNRIDTTWLNLKGTTYSQTWGQPWAMYSYHTKFSGDNSVISLWGYFCSDDVDLGESTTETSSSELTKLAGAL